jgi:hypothetical protein
MIPVDVGIRSSLDDAVDQLPSVDLFHVGDGWIDRVDGRGLVGDITVARNQVAISRESHETDAKLIARTTVLPTYRGRVFLASLLLN